MYVLVAMDVHCTECIYSLCCIIWSSLVEMIWTKKMSIPDGAVLGALQNRMSYHLCMALYELLYMQLDANLCLPHIIG